MGGIPFNEIFWFTMIMLADPIDAIIAREIPRKLTALKEGPITKTIPIKVIKKSNLIERLIFSPSINIE